MRKRTFSKNLTIIIIFFFTIGLLAGGFFARQYFPRKEIIQKEVSKEEQPTEIGNKFIIVTSLKFNQKIKSPVKISGKANVFEAAVSIRIKDSNSKTLVETSVMAEGAMDKLYPFTKSVSYKKPSSQNGIVEVFEISAKDGSEINKVVIPVIFEDYKEE
jgi:flagellar basal body-associated protein FliL